MMFNLAAGWMGLALYTFILTLLQALNVKAGLPISSMIEVVGFGHLERGNELTDLLAYRDLNDDPVLKRANEIIKVKLAGSTPLQDAAVELISACKLVNEKSESFISADHAKETAIQIYGIKATDTSLAAAGVKLPRACDRFCGRAHSSWLPFSSDTSNELHGPSLAGERKACVNALYKVDNSWTSYESHRQDAKSLCETATLEHAPRLMLEMLKDFTEVIPSMMEMFRQQDVQQQAFMERTRNNAREMDDIHLTQMQTTGEQHKTSMMLAKELFKTANDGVHDLYDNMRGDVSAVGGDIKEIQSALAAARHDSQILADLNYELHRQLQMLSTDTVAIQARGMREFESVSLRILQSVDEYYHGLEGQVGALSNAVRASMLGIADGQHEISQVQEAFMLLQDMSMERQRESLGVSDQLLENVSEITLQIGWLAPLLKGVSEAVEFVSGLGLRPALCAGSLAFLLLCCGFRKQAGIVVAFFIAMLTLPALGAVCIQSIEVLRTVAADVVGNVIGFMEKRWSAAIFVMILLSLSATILLKVWVSGHQHAVTQAAEEVPDRFKRAQTTAPDFSRPRSRRSETSISKRELLVDQKRLGRRMTGSR